MEDAGWIAGSWEQLTEGALRPRRRFYALTPTGVEAAREVAAAPARAFRWLRPLQGFGLVAGQGGAR